LEDFEIVFVCDDSGSMNTNVDGGDTTRWDELKNIVAIVAEVAAALDDNGIDVFFLNRSPVEGVRTSSQIHEAFRRKPSGGTPIGRTLQLISTKYDKEKAVLVLLATDGEPSDKDIFRAWIKNMPPKWYMSIIVCTDDKKAVKYLDKIDKDYENIDVVDDFNSENQQIQRKLKRNITHAEYIAKIMLGPIDPFYDKMDELNKMKGPTRCLIQ
jgi:glutaredoxin